MKRNKHILVIVVIILVLFVTCGMVSAQHVLISASEGAFMDIPLEIIREAYKRIGITMEIKWLPAERAVYMANGGKVDGDLLRIEGIEDDYPSLLRVPVPIKTEDIIVITKDKKFEIDGWNSLIPYKVGYVRGVKVIEMNLAKGTVAEPVNTGKQAYRKLVAGRTDIVVDLRPQAQLTLKKLGLENLVVLDPPLTTIPFFHYLNVKNQHLIQPLASVLQQMEQEGLIQHITEQAEARASTPSKYQRRQDKDLP